jgi:hypothetical protein
MEKELKLVNTINKDELGIPKGALIGLIGVNKQEPKQEPKKETTLEEASKNSSYI